MKSVIKRVITGIIIFFIVFLFKSVEVKANVLILNSYDRGFKWTKDINKGIDDILDNDKDIRVYYEFMDAKHKNNKEYLNILYDMYKEKYENTRFDVIICSDNDALNFLVDRGEKIFKDTPVVFCGINDFNKGMLNDRKKFTGVIEEIQVESTIDSILKLQPNVKNIGVICDSSTTGKIDKEKTLSVVKKFKNKVKFNFYTDVTGKELKNKAKLLGPNSVLLDIAQLRGEKGELIPFEKTVANLPETNIPIYVCWDFLIDDKIIGGKVIGGYSQGEKAAKIALQIINGKEVKHIPIVKESPSKYVFNYEELLKYKIRLHNLPKESYIINKPFSFYESYKKIIFITLGVGVLLLMFIVILSINIRKRIKSEKKLSENYEELSAVYGELAATEEELRAQYEEIQENQRILTISEEKYMFLAYYDGLTLLQNRTSFFKKLETEIEKVKNDNTRGALFFIDIDNFKMVNDTLGHDYGDELLKKISNRLSKILKDGEDIFRLGGDEFTILQSNIKDIDNTKKLAESVLRELDKPFNIKERTIFTTASVGISVFPENGLEQNIIFKNADTAMYKAKEKGKNKYLFYDEHMLNEIIRKTELEKALRMALERDEFKLFYQPQVRSSDGSIVAVEALIRWANPEVGVVSPGEFIPLAEQNSLIIPIGMWVLRTACVRGKRWIDKGFTPIVVSVNVSVNQIYEDGFLNMVKGILEETKFPPEYLELEITESVFMQCKDENINILNELKNMGIKIALDDFGTGYSSLNYLRRIPINKLKLDKCFIDEIHINSKYEAVVDGIIQLTHKLGYKVIAEGVELKEQYDLLKKINCDEIQGYYFSKPLPEEELVKKYLFGLYTKNLQDK